jgi:hypothetical protein
MEQPSAKTIDGQAKWILRRKYGSRVSERTEKWIVTRRMFKGLTQQQQHFLLSLHKDIDIY